MMPRDERKSFPNFLTLVDLTPIRAGIIRNNPDAWLHIRQTHSRPRYGNLFLLLQIDQVLEQRPRSRIHCLFGHFLIKPNQGLIEIHRGSHDFIGARLFGQPSSLDDSVDIQGG